MALWPDSLPTYPDDGAYTELLPNSLLITPQDIGPPKVRRRGTGFPSIAKVSYTLTQAQVATFTSFFLDSVEGGSEFFRWPHPRLAYDVEARFSTIPTVSSAGYDLFVLSTELELESNEEATAGWFFVGWFTDWF